ncbi:MAG: aspartate-semialdehyde dehydrogenase, partial [Acidobacteriota bacterium]
MKANSSGYSMAIVSPTTLKGKELREVLVEKRFPVKKMRLLDVKEEGKLTEFDGEPKLVQKIKEDSFDGVDIAFFCGDPTETAKYLPLAEKKGFTAIDLSQALLAKKNVPVVVAGINDGKILRNRGIIKNPHPITISLCTVLHLLKRAF